MCQQRARMDPLASIWDDPVSPARPGREDKDDSDEGDDIISRPAKRQRQALFLADSDDDDDDIPSTRLKHTAPAEQDIDVNEIFAGIDDDDDPFTFQPLAPALDTEVLRRQAEERHKKTALSLTPHEVHPSSSPQRDTSKEKNDGAGAGDGNKESRKERRKPVTLDEGRLLGPNGFPQLIKETKNFRVKGKGHEATDLNRLLNVYQFWTHRMYPKTQFRDTVQRIEKLCHSKRMHVAASVWRDEAHGLVNGKKVQGDEIIDLTEHSGQNADTPSGPESEAVQYAPSSSPAASRPPSSATDFDDDFDMDTVIREEEERSARESAITSIETTQPITATQQPFTEDGDEALWSMFDDAPVPKPPAQLPLVTVNPNADEDEDMWDVVRELENEPAPTLKTSAPPPSQAVTIGEPMMDRIVGEAEEGWDDVYE